jgi:hypothetical protein
MTAGTFLRLIIYTPIVAGGGVYCWRHGIRWSKNITIKGLPARVGAVILFIAASLMFLSVLFPRQAEHLVDSLDKRFGGPPRTHHQAD